MSALLDHDADRLLTPEEAGELLGGVSAWTMRQWARERKVPAVKVGKFWKYRRQALIDWISEHERAAR